MQKRVYAKRTLEGIEVAAWSDRAGQDVVVGVEVSKATLELVIRWANRAFARPITVPNPGGILEALTRLRQLHEGALKVAMEPSGTYGDAFRQACHDADLTVWRVRPKAAHDYAEVFDGVPSQHDGKEEAIIAELAAIGTLYIAPASPWENGYAESFFSRLRDELLNAELFADLREAKALAASWQNEYNHRRPHSSLGYLTPAAFAAKCAQSADKAAVTESEEKILGALPPNPRLLSPPVQETELKPKGANMVPTLITAGT